MSSRPVQQPHAARPRSGSFTHSAKALLAVIATAGIMADVLALSSHKAALASVQTQTSAPPPPELQNSQDAQIYIHQVQPILQTNCYRCHAGLNHRGGFQMDTPAGMLRGGRDGVVIVPGHPEQSLLMKLIRHEGPADKPMPMPPKSKLSDVDIATIAKWIQAGASMPAQLPAL